MRHTTSPYPPTPNNPTLPTAVVPLAPLPFVNLELKGFKDFFLNPRIVGFKRVEPKGCRIQDCLNPRIVGSKVVEVKVV